MDEFRLHPQIGMIIAIITLLVGVNLVYLDIVVFEKLAIQTPSEPVSIQAPTAIPLDTSCPQSCIVKMEELAQRTTAPAKTSTTANSNTPAPPVNSNSIKEYFIPFGSGAASSMDWEDVPGLQGTIDTTNYPQIKTVTFEVSLRIPTGNQIAYARLYNATDKHPVWFSDVSVDGGVAKLVVSPSVSLDPGNKTYQVQVKTSLGYQTFVDQSRLRITTK